MIVEKNIEGAWLVSETIDGYLETKAYYFYTKKQAVKLFKEYKKQLTKGK